MSRIAGSCDRGEGALSYLAIVLLVATVVTALVASSVPGAVTGGVQDALCRVTGTSCSGPRSGPPGAYETGRDPTGKGGAGEPTDTYWDCGWLGREFCGFTQGFYRGLSEQVTGAWDGVTFAGCLAHLCGDDAFEDGWNGIGRLFTTNPLTTLGSLWDDSTKEIREDWNNGHKATAFGRTILTAASMISGVGRLSGGARLARHVPHPPADAQRAAETAADQAADAARRGDAEGAREAAATADDEADEAESLAADDPTAENKEAAAKARQAADEARSATLDAEVRALGGRSRRLREAIEILDRYKVTTIYRKGGGTYYSPRDNTIYIDIDRRDTVGWQAMSLTHEALHAEWWHTEKTANGLAHRMKRTEWVNAMVKEEIAGAAREMEAARELRAQGVQVAEHPVERTYRQAFEAAVAQGKDGARAGAEALLEEYRSGRIAASHTGKSYPDTYGEHWDDVNIPPAKKPGK